MSSVVDACARAFIDALKGEDLSKFVNQLALLESCLQDRDFAEVLKNPFIHPQEKLGFVLSVLSIGDSDQGLKNALSVLANSGRLALLRDVLVRMQDLLEFRSKKCRGVLFSPKIIEPSLVASFREELERKIGYGISLDQRVWDREGIKCYLEGLNLEISFSREKFVEELKNIVLFSVNQRSMS